MKTIKDETEAAYRFEASDLARPNEDAIVVAMGSAFLVTHDRVSDVYRVIDHGTGRQHDFTGNEARALLGHGHELTEGMSNSQLSDILFAALPYPRTLRLNPNECHLSVVEVSARCAEILYGDILVGAAYNDDADYIRAICRTPNDFVRNIENALGAEGAFAPRMTRKQSAPVDGKEPHRLTATEIEAINEFAREHELTCHSDGFKAEILVLADDPRFQWEAGDVSRRIASNQSRPRPKQPVGVAFQVSDDGIMRLMPLTYQTGAEFLGALDRSMSHASSPEVSRRTQTFAP